MTQRIGPKMNYYVNLASIGNYVSAKRFVIQLDANERIVGVNRDVPVVVVAPQGSLHAQRGIMPTECPYLGAASNFGWCHHGGHINVFHWTKECNCLFPESVLWTAGRIDTEVLICRPRQRLESSNTPNGVWEWSVAPLQDMNPELTAREVVIDELLRCVGFVN